MSNDVRRWNTDGDLELDSDGVGELVLASDHERAVAFWKELAEKRYQEMTSCQKTIASQAKEIAEWKTKADDYGWKLTLTRAEIDGLKKQVEHFEANRNGHIMSVGAEQRQTIAQLRAELEHAKRETADAMSGCCDCPMMKSTWREHEKELETARRVREKLTEQRNEAIYLEDRRQWEKASDAIAECDAEIAAIEKDGTK